MAEGFVFLYRCLHDKPIWLNSTPEHKVVLISLLTMANHKPNVWEWKGERFEVKEGQILTSLNSILMKCGKGVTIQNIRSALKRFEKLQFLTNESTKTGRLITIVNWRVYQVGNPKSNKGPNKEVTKNQQRGNKEVTPNNNDNNDNNVLEKDTVLKKNETPHESCSDVPVKLAKKAFGENKKVKLTEVEHEKLIEKLGLNKANDLITDLDLYITSKGKKYKSHYATILSWDRKNQKKNTSNRPEKKYLEIE